MYNVSHLALIRLSEAPPFNSLINDVISDLRVARVTSLFYDPLKAEIWFEVFGLSSLDVDSLLYDKTMTSSELKNLMGNTACRLLLEGSAIDKESGIKSILNCRVLLTAAKYENGTIKINGYSDIGSLVTEVKILPTNIFDKTLTSGTDFESQEIVYYKLAQLLTTLKYNCSPNIYDFYNALRSGVNYDSDLTSAMATHMLTQDLTKDE